VAAIMAGQALPVKPPAPAPPALPTPVAAEPQAGKRGAVLPRPVADAPGS